MSLLLSVDHLSRASMAVSLLYKDWICTNSAIRSSKAPKKQNGYDIYENTHCISNIINNSFEFNCKKIQKRMSCYIGLSI